MAAQTLNDVLSRTREFHSRLSECLGRSSDRTDNTRAELLLDYLQDHEQKLSRALEVMQNSADHKQLDTWFYEFTQKHNVIRTSQENKAYAEMDVDDIMAAVTDQHKQIIELYRYLYGRAGTSPARELLKQLIDLEEHEAMRLSQQGSRSNEY
jgi:hypothetical protein